MNQHIDSVLAEELRELTGDQPPGLDLDAVIRRGHVLRRRRFAVSGAGAAVLAASVAAIALTVSSGSAGLAARPAAAPGSPSTAGEAGSPATAGPAPIQSASVLQARLMAAYSAAKASLKVTDVSTAFGETTRTVTVPSQMWQETTNWNQSGVKESVQFTSLLPRPERLTLTVYNGKNQKETLKNRLFWVFKTLTIDYSTRTFSTGTWYALDEKNSEQNIAADYFAPPQPESLKTSSWSKLTGTATVDGQPAYVLTQTGSGGVTATTWVNRQTLLPVKDVVHTYAGTSTDNYTYSTAIGATAAASTPAIPPGFTRAGSTAAGGPAAKPA